jgi:hypothetical protein
VRGCQRFVIIRIQNRRAALKRRAVFAVALEGGADLRAACWIWAGTARHETCSRSYTTRPTAEVLYAKSRSVAIRFC